MRYFRKIEIVVLVLLFKCSFGQFNQNIYDFNSIPYSYTFNPGMEFSENFKFYFNVPIISFNVNAHLTAFTVKDIFDKNKTPQQTIIDIADNVDRNSFISANASSKILDIGIKWYNKNTRERWIFSFGIDLRGYAYLTYPQDIAIILAHGYGYDYVADMSDTKGEISIITSYDFGVNYKKDNSPITFGTKFKIYNSVATLSTKNSSYFHSVPSSEGNVKLYFNNDFSVRTSGVYDDVNISDIFFSGNIGAGIDLGFTDQVTENFKVTGSITDLGFIYHGNDTKEIRYKETYYIDSSYTNTDSFSDIMEDFFESGDTIEGQSFFTYVPTSVNLGFTYTLFGRPKVTKEKNVDCAYCDNKSVTFIPKHNFGLQLHSLFKNWNPYFGATLFYHSQMYDFFEFKATYTIEKNNFYNIGAIASLNLGSSNIFLSLENMIGLVNLYSSNAQSITFGYYFTF